MIFLNSWWLIPFIIFSLAATKRHTYLLICAPALFLILAYFILYLLQEYKGKRWIASIVVILLVLLPIRYCIERVKPFKNVGKEPAWKTELVNMRGKFDERTVFMNFEHSIEGMFYTDYIFYDRLPNDGEIELLKKKGYTIIIKP